LSVLDRNDSGASGINDFDAFVPDGMRISLDSGDNAVRVWKANGGEPPLLLHGHDDQVSSVAFSPDGTRIVTGSWDKTVRVWSAINGECMLVLRGHDALVSSVAFSPDGTRIVSGSWDKTVRVWNATSGASQLFTTLDGPNASLGWPPGTLGLRDEHDNLVTSVAFSPDGTRIVSGSSDDTVRVWNATSGENLLVLRDHDSVFSVAFSPDGTRIVSGSNDKTVRVWDVSSGQSLLVLPGHDESVESVAFSPDGSRIVSGSGDKTVRVWDAARGEALLVLRGHDSWISSVAFSCDGSRIVTGSWDGTVRVWESSAAMIHDPNREATVAAMQLVRSLFGRLALGEDVVHVLQTDSSLREDVRAVAIRLARLRGGESPR
jgi:WD40 repeat protein